jgi:adenine deaminase
MLAFERFGRFFGMPGRGTVADLIVVPHDSQGQPRHVIVGGRLIVEDGAFLSADLEAIRSEAKDAASKLWQRMAAI